MNTRNYFSFNDNSIHLKNNAQSNPEINDFITTKQITDTSSLILSLMENPKWPEKLLPQHNILANLVWFNLHDLTNKKKDIPDLDIITLLNYSPLNNIYKNLGLAILNHDERLFRLITSSYHMHFFWMRGEHESMILKNSFEVLFRLLRQVDIKDTFIIHKFCEKFSNTPHTAKYLLKNAHHFIKTGKSIYDANKTDFTPDDKLLIRKISSTLMEIKPTLLTSRDSKDKLPLQNAPKEIQELFIKAYIRHHVSDKHVLIKQGLFSPKSPLNVLVEDVANLITSKLVDNDALQKTTPLNPRRF